MTTRGNMRRNAAVLSCISHVFTGDLFLQHAATILRMFIVSVPLSIFMVIVRISFVIVRMCIVIVRNSLSLSAVRCHCAHLHCHGTHCHGQFQHCCASLSLCVVLFVRLLNFSLSLFFVRSRGIALGVLPTWVLRAISRRQERVCHFS